jgi:hypothetical protein
MTQKFEHSALQRKELFKKLLLIKPLNDFEYQRKHTGNRKKE